jgi:hypothetical protein
VPSHEQQLVRVAAESEDEARQARLLARQREDFAAVRAGFRDSDDEVNESWVDCQLRGITDLDAMVKETGHTKEDFYAAQKRRQRAVERVPAERRGAPVDADDDDEEKT